MITYMESLFEATLPKDYRRDDIDGLLKFILSGRFCQLISLPGGGKATILKLLAYNRPLRVYHLGVREKDIRFLYLNLLDLPNFEQQTIEKFLLLSLAQKIEPSNDPLILSQQLKDVVREQTNQKLRTLILLFDHFDEYQNRLARSFFQLLRSLRSLGKYRFTAVFATRRDLAELIDEDIKKTFYDFFVGNSVYMKLADERAITFMFSQLEEVFGGKLKNPQKEKLIAITGGHTKLLRVLTETVLQEGADIHEEAFLSRPIVEATLFELWHFLTSQEQKALVAIAKKKQNKEIPQTLKDFGLLREEKTVLQFSIPLFATFVKDIASKLREEHVTYDAKTKEVMKGDTAITDLLSLQEYRLLTFFIKNEGRVIEREEIVRAVWSDTKAIEGISEAAIDQMVHRLRKKVEDEPNDPKHVVTVKGRGFRFFP